MTTILMMKQCVLYAVLLFPEFSDIHSFTRVVQRNWRQEIYVLRTVHFGMKLYNDQRKEKVFNLLTYLPYLFQVFC
jgi:hypothetical protein